MHTLDQGCPTRGPRAACGSLDKLVRLFLLLSCHTPFFKGKKRFLGSVKFSREANLVERTKHLSGEQTIGRYCEEKIRFQKKEKVIEKVDEK